MADFFKNNPIALRHCIRFEVLQGTPIDKAYSNICSVIGKEVIDYENFKLSFNQFSGEKCNEEKKEIPCARMLRNDKYALRVCILYESLKYQSDKPSDTIFGIFVNFCKVIGNEDVLKYPEFEFWFYRFLNGESDLNYERDKEKKIYELMDMPIDIMTSVVEYLDIFDRANLVQTSRSLQTFVEDQKLFHHTLKLYISFDTATVSLGKSVNIQYIKYYSVCKKIFKERETSVEGVAYWKQAIRDIKMILKNPKLHLNTLVIGLNGPTELLFDNLKSALKFTHHLNVKNIILSEYSSYLLTIILPTLKPGYLTTINLDYHNPNIFSMNKVFEMEQWKQAKSIRMDSYFIGPLHHLYHFKEFTVYLERLSVENIRQMKAILFKSPDFEKCSVCVVPGIDRSTIEQEFGNALREDSNIYHYPIDKSTEYFEIKVDRFNCVVTRKKKQF